MERKEYLGALAVVDEELLPFNTLKFKEKIKYEHWVHEVNKCISHIALSLRRLERMVTFKSIGR